MRFEHMALKTEEAYLGWIKRFFYHFPHLDIEERDESHIEEYLTHLALVKKVTSKTQNQTLNSIIYLYKKVLKKEVKDINALTHLSPKYL